jgi:hypothetical protein
MKLNKNILDFDLVIQTLIIGFACLFLMSAVFAPYFIFYYLMIQLALGFWQVLSAFLITMITGNKSRIQYLVGVLAYFINLALFTYFLGVTDYDYKFTQIIVWIVIPAIYATWYFKMTYAAVKNNDIKVAESILKNGNQQNIWSTKEFV